MRRCLTENETTLILTKVNEDVCGSYIIEKVLANKLLSASYYWPNMLNDIAEYVKNAIYANNSKIYTTSSLRFCIQSSGLGHFVN